MPAPAQGLKQIFASLPVFRNVGSKAQQWAGEDEFVDLQVGRTCWAGVQRKMRTELWCVLLAIDVRKFQLSLVDC